MPKKRSSSPKPLSMEGVPKTVRELRARLEELGNPWHVHPSLSDDDPLPRPPRGGMLEEQKDTFANVKQMREALRATPPTNPFLQQVWIDAGWMKKKEGHGIVASTNDPPMPPDGTADQPRPGTKRKKRSES